MVGSFVRMIDQHTMEELIGTPRKTVSDYFNRTIFSMFRDTIIKNEFAFLGNQYVAKQSFVIPERDFMEPPDAYVLTDIAWH